MAPIGVALFAVALLAACGESREEAAERIGAVDIDPRKTFGTLRKSLGPQAEVLDASDHKIRDLVKVQFGPKGSSGEPLLELWFHSASRDVAPTARPIMVIARPPFKGTVMGVRLGDSLETAWRPVRQREPRVPPSYPGAAPPPPTGGWLMALEGAAHIAWAPSLPGKTAEKSTGEAGELRFVDRYYTVQRPAVTIDPKRSSKTPASAAVSPGSFPFMLYADGYSGRPLRFFIDDRLVAADRVEQPAKLPEQIEIASPSEDGPRLTAQVLRPCGWRDIPVSVNLRLMPRVGADGSFVEHGIVRFGIHSEHAYNHFFVDNRGRPGSKLKLGEFVHDIPANDKTSVMLPAPDCESATSLEMDGKPIAKLPVASDTKDGSHYLLDPSGKRCYEYKHVQYGLGPFPHQRKVDPPVRFAAQHLHRLPAKANYALERAPARIKSRSIWTYVTQLLDVPC